MTGDPMAQDGMTRVLADGSRLPMLGLGVWQVPDGPECVGWGVRGTVPDGLLYVPTRPRQNRPSSGGMTCPARCLARSAEPDVHQFVF